MNLRFTSHFSEYRIILFANGRMEGDEMRRWQKQYLPSSIGIKKSTVLHSLSKLLDTELSINIFNGDTSL